MEKILDEAGLVDHIALTTTLSKGRAKSVVRKYLNLGVRVETLVELFKNQGTHGLATLDTIYNLQVEINDDVVQKIANIRFE